MGTQSPRMTVTKRHGREGARKVTQLDLGTCCCNKGPVSWDITPYRVVDLLAPAAAFYGQPKTSFAHPCLSARQKTDVAETRAVLAVTSKGFTKRSPPHRRLSPAGSKSIATPHTADLFNDAVSCYGYGGHWQGRKPCSSGTWCTTNP